MTSDLKATFHRYLQRVLAVLLSAIIILPAVWVLYILILGRAPGTPVAYIEDIPTPTVLSDAFSKASASTRNLGTSCQTGLDYTQRSERPAMLFDCQQIELSADHPDWATIVAEYDEVLTDLGFRYNDSAALVSPDRQIAIWDRFGVLNLEGDVVAIALEKNATDATQLTLQVAINR